MACIAPTLVFANPTQPCIIISSRGPILSVELSGHVATPQFRWRALKATRSQVIKCLVEGMSINGICRITDTAKHTVLKLLADVGEVCQQYQDEHLRGLNCRRIECDEIWAFCYAKQKNVPIEYQGQFGYGDVWTWTAIDAETKLIPCWYVGRRDAGAARQFILDLASRLNNRIQLTTDGHRAYLTLLMKRGLEMLITRCW